MKHIKFAFPLQSQNFLKIYTFLLIMGSLLVCFQSSYGQQKETKSNLAAPKYLDPNLPVEQRLDDLLPRLTLEEKIIQLVDSWGSKGIPRLKVPPMLKTEGLHGQSYSSGATIYPHAIEMASTFNTSLIKQIGKATGVESKAAGLRASWSPVLDVARDARWGRVEETYGEDPYLVSRMGVSWINGFQGENMIAVPKHFAGHGEPLGGRDSQDVGLSDRVMRNVHLVPFRAAIKEAQAGGVMAAYGTWNGVPDNGSTELLQKVLREEWGFKGIVISDCGGIENFVRKQSTATDLMDASAIAIIAGVDIECGSAYVKALMAAVQKGLLRESDLDPNVRRVLRTKFMLGLFENPGTGKMVWDKLPEYDTPEHRALAREVAVQGSVLLKNKDKLLPLRKDLKTIAVIGPNADEAQTGDYSGKSSPGQSVTVLTAVKSHVSSSTKVIYSKGCDVLSPDTTNIARAVETARQADAVILVVGDYGRNVPNALKSTTGENVDGATLEIPGMQRRLIKAIQATGKPVVLVLVNGKPFTLAWEDENIDAILETWFPGEEGGNATADLIFGDRNPAGRLPITFPRHVGQLPLHYNYEPSGRNYDYYDMPFKPLYRFGSGLSYTSFKYSNLQAIPKKDNPGYVTVNVDIENTGDRDGDEVAQLYITDMLTSVNTPVIELKGFERVTLKKGEKKSVAFELTPYQLSLLNPAMVRVLEPGIFKVHVGGVCPEPVTGSTEHKIKIGFKDPVQGVSGEFEVPRRYQADFDYDLKAPAVVKGGESFMTTVTIKNNGNLLDIANIKLYADKLSDTRRFEIEPGETKSHTFDVTLYKSGIQQITAIVGSKIVTRSVNVTKAPAKLTLSKVRSSITDDGVLHYTAMSGNTGSDLYKGSVSISVEGKVEVNQPLSLEAGAKKDVSLTYAFPRSGRFSVKVGDAAAQQMIVPGGIGLALKDPLVYLSFDEQFPNGVKDQITGAILPMQGTPSFVAGKNGKGFKTGDKQTFIKAGGLDLYRKPFTLAAWVNIESFENGQAGLFSGQAPMGADIDITGTILNAGIQDESLRLGFQDRDINGGAKITTNKWTHVAYTYNPELEMGSLYINGKLDKSLPQKTYAGPLDMIGSSIKMKHGKYLMDEVLITKSTLGPIVIKELADKGMDALQSGTMVTEWRPFTSAGNKLQTWSEVPENSRITVTVESGDDAGKVVDSKTIVVKTGLQNNILDNMKPGTKIRLCVQLSTTKWGTLPVLQTAILSGATESQKWSTTEEWQKGSASSGLKVGL